MTMGQVLAGVWTLAMPALGPDSGLLAVAVFTEGLGAVAPTAKRRLTERVTPAGSVVGTAVALQLTVVPVWVQPVVVPAPICSVKPVGTTSVRVTPVASALPMFAYWMT